MKKALLFAFLVGVISGICRAIEAPLLATWQLDPYNQTTDNVVAAIERVTPTADGGLIVDVGFNMEPSEAPTIQFVYSSKGSNGAPSGGALTQLADASVCSFPDQSMTIENRMVYAYTLPQTIVPISPSRMVYARRCRFGGLTYSGRKLEGGGYAIVEEDAIYMGRSGTFTIGGREITFEGGILLEPNTVAETASANTRIRIRTPPNTPLMINGKPMSFPVKLKTQEVTE